MKASELRPNTANTYTPLFLLLLCLKVTLVHISHSFCLKIQPTHYQTIPLKSTYKYNPKLNNG